MFAITGITGQVGGVVGRTLRDAGCTVRAVVRDADKGAAWKAQGCEVALAKMEDPAGLRRAFTGAESVFVLLPPNFDPSPGFPETRVIVAALHAALSAARPKRVVVLSTVGAQAKQENLLTQLAIQEQVLRELPMPLTFLRPAWFCENAAWDIAPARESGAIASFLRTDVAIPMVATADVGRTAAGLLREDHSGQRIVELAGPRSVSPDQLAATLGRLLGREVRAQSVPRGEWEAMFRAQGMRNPGPRMRMLDGFREGWLTFESEPRRGVVELEDVLKGLIAG